MSFVKGENIILFIYDGDMWKPVVCGRDCSFTTNAEDIETSITGSGAWRTYEYVALTWSCTFDGLFILDGINQLSLQDLRAYQYSRQKVYLRYQREDDNGNVYTDEGYALISSISDSGNYNDVGSFSVELKGTGPLDAVLTPTTVNPAGKVMRFEYTATGGEDSFTDSDLIGKDIVDVVVDGVGRSRILTSGTPVGQEVLYGSATGIITLPFDLMEDTEVYVLYQDI